MAYKNPEDKKEYSKRYCEKPEVKKRRSETNKLWRENNKDLIIKRGAERRIKKRAMCMVATVRIRSKRKMINFDLDEHIEQLQKIIDDGFCQFSGLPFDLSPGLSYNSPSIDRIDPEKGYTFDNVRIILQCLNCAFGNWGESVFLEVIKSSTKFRSSL